MTRRISNGCALGGLRLFAVDHGVSKAENDSISKPHVHQDLMKDMYKRCVLQETCLLRFDEMVRGLECESLLVLVSL